MQRRIFITGGTGYIGQRLIPALTARGHEVTALVRRGSEKKLKTKCAMLTGDALNGDSYGGALGAFDTFIHLVGVPHPSPAKAREFVEIDLNSAEGAIRVAAAARISHFIYLSVAHPAPAMAAYWGARAKAEAALRASGLNATVLRPWYVLGPGHWWPVVLKPIYFAAELVPSLREGALRLGLVSLDEMVRALVVAAERPVNGLRVVEVPEIRRAS